MRKIIVFFLVLVVLGISFTLFSDDDDDEKLKLAVMEFEDLSGKLPKKMLSVATEQIRGKFVSSNKFIVIAKERQEKAMISKMKEESYKDCNDKNCQIPLGQALSADTILRTTITFFGGTYTIISELIDLEKEATIKGAEATFNGNEKSLKEAINSIVTQIVGRQQQQSNFQTGRFGGKTEDWEIGAGAETIVKFESNPAGAIVFADGKILCQSTPCEKTLTEGNHNIEMQMVNYDKVSKKEEIKKGKVIKYTLEPDFAWLWVTGNRNVQLKLDGKNIGEIPIEGKQITPGNHKIEHSDRCFYDSGENFTIKRGEKKTIKFNLEPRESAIKVNAQDEKGNDIKADVFVDDKKVGRSPGTFKVPLCSNEIRIKKDGFAEYSEILELKEKKVAEFRPKLKSNSPAKEYDGAPKWVLSGGGDSPNEICDVGIVNKSKTDKLMIERATQHAEVQIAFQFKIDNDPSQKIVSSHTLDQVRKKHFIKDKWKSVSGTMYVLVCISNKDAKSLVKKVKIQEEKSACEKARKKQGLLPWAEYLENYPYGICASEAAANIKEYKKQNAKKDFAEIEKRRKKTGKYWSDTAHYKMNYNDAQEYCDNLDEGGFDDWHLPTIDELRSLVTNCKETVINGNCGITNSCSTEDCFLEAFEKSDCWCPLNKTVYSKLGDKGTFWSSSGYWLPDTGYDPEAEPIDYFREGYLLNFDSGGIIDDFLGVSSNMNEMPFVEILVPYNVRCVR